MANKRRDRTRLERALVGPAGEHFVLYKLHMEGMLASLAPNNAPSVDILVLNEDETIAASIQVKTRTYGADGGWHMKSKHEKLARPNLFYVFVDFEPEVPAAFVVPSAVVAAVVRESHASWLATPGRKGRTHKDGDLRRILPRYKTPVTLARDGWLEPYKNNWAQLRQQSPLVAPTGGRPKVRSRIHDATRPRRPRVRALRQALAPEVRSALRSLAR